MPKPGYGKYKGGKFERQTCQRLSLWVSNLARKDVFWRSAMSGGRHTVHRKKGGAKTDAHAGDVTLTHPSGAAFVELFVVECKHYKETNVEQLIFGKRGWITAVWEKLVEECDGRREPFLVLRQNLQPEMVFTSLTGYRWLRGCGPLPLVATFPRHDICVVFFRDVLMTSFIELKPIAVAQQNRSRRLKLK